MLVLTFFIGHSGIYAQDTHTDVVPNGAVAKKLSSDDFSFTEGPVWYRDSILLFTSYSSRENRSKIYSYNSIENKFGVFRDNIAANGLTCDKDGNLLSTNGHSVVMVDQNGKTTKTLASNYNNKPFTSPNDIIADNKGGVYFSDLHIFGSPIQDKDAVYYVDSTGVVKRVIEDMGSNGVILSPDGKKLYVSGGEDVYSYDVAPDGSLSGQSVFAELQIIDGVVTGSDGMAIDIYGNLYVSVYTGVQIFSAQGTFITDIKIPKGSLNCDFGGKDFKTLYITEFNSLYSIDLNYPGFAVSRNNTSAAINSISKQSLLTLYPNPVQNVLHLNLPAKTGILEVFDITGKSLLQRQIQQDNPSLDVSDLENGIYFVKVVSDNQFAIGKFVKQ